MNKYFKLLISVILLLTSIAYTSSTNELEANLEGEFINSSVNNELTIANNYLNIASLKQELQNCKYQLSNLELAKEIRIAVGENTEVVNGMEDDLLLEALNYKEVRTKTNYFKVDAYGNSIQISKSQFDLDVDSILKKKKATQYENVNSIASDFQNEWHSQDGYLKITSTASRTNGDSPERDYYILSGTAEWEIIPFTKSEDVLVINSSANIDNYYDYYGGAYYNVECTGSDSHRVLDNYTEYAYRNNNNSDLVYVYNPSPYGIAVRANLDGRTCESVDFEYPGYGAWHETTWKKIVIYGQYKVSLYNIDASCQVAYSHKTYGFEFIEPSITIYGISFSIAGISEKVDYFANSFTIQFIPGHDHIYRYEQYSPIQHKSICTDCGYYSYEYHNLIPQQGGWSYCRECNYISDISINSEFTLTYN